MKDVMVWMMLVFVFVMGFVFFIMGMMYMFFCKLVEQKYEYGVGGGLVGVFDVVWLFSVYEVGQECDWQIRCIVLVFVFGDLFGVFEDGWIVIYVCE